VRNAVELRWEEGSFLRKQEEGMLSFAQQDKGKKKEESGREVYCFSFCLKLFTHHIYVRM